MAAIIKSSVEIVESFYNTVFDESTSDFIGLITLLHNTVMRFMYNANEKQAEEDTVLYDLLRKHYSFAFTCAEKVSAYIEKEQGWQFTRNDVSFLTLYISRVTANKF
jgi:beta-glucoside operon transcriptional antiterminator